jgi:hypothetical protein
VVSIVFVLALALSPTRDAPVSLVQYARDVHAVRVVLDRAATHQSTTQLARIQARLRTLGAVRFPSGAVIHTDLPLLAREIAPTDIGSVRQAAATLDALDEALTPATVGRTDPRALATLDAVLKDPRFHPARPFWAPVADWITQLRNRIIQWLFDRLTNSPGTFSGFGVVLVLLVAGLACLLARGALSRLVVEASDMMETETPGTSAAAEERSRAASVAGNQREALRYLFLATMLALQEHGALELRPGLTNREYLRQMRRQMPNDPSLEAGLDELVDTFDAVWYGHVPFGAADLDRMRAVSQRILRTVAREAA